MPIPHLLTAVLSPVAVAAAAVVPQDHPHLDDGGALQWQTRLAAAKTEARRADELILVAPTKK